MTLCIRYDIFLTGIKLYLDFCVFYCLIIKKKNHELPLGAPLGIAPSFNYFI